MTALFLFGTLLDNDLRDIFAHPSTGRTAYLADHVIETVADGDFPVCLRRAGGRADGLLIADVPPADLARLDYYEAIFGYIRRSVEVDCHGIRVKAEAYFPPDNLLSSGTPWDLSDWQRRWAPFARLRAHQVMDEYHIGTPAADVAGKWPVLAARAQAELAAAKRPAPRRAEAPDASEIQDLATRTVYSRFFRVDERDLSVPSFGARPPLEMERVVFLSVDAVTVLPYDRKRDRVLLIEQFRVGPHARGDTQPWLLEAIAGRVDGGESWEEAATREAKEEAGLELAALEKVAEFYPSPGSMSEFIVSYVGYADLPNGIEGLHGVASEHEDIRTRLVEFAEFEKLLEDGHVRNAPLLVSAQWLVANRGRLLVAANGA